MFDKVNARYLGVAFLTMFICTLAGNPGQSQEAEVPPETTTDPMPEPEPAPEPETTQTPPAPVVVPAPAGQPQTIVYSAPAGSGDSHAQGLPLANPFINLRKMPKKLRPIEGQEPPFGYVEVERRKRGLVIAGAAVFGGFYIGCVALSTTNRLLLVPLAGPAIAGFSYESDSEYTGSNDAEYAARLFGTLGTIAQSAGVAMFIIGMASKKKLWLRQDIAGMSLQLAPTVVGRSDPGLGVYGTF